MEILKNDKYLVGYDLTSEYAQISYCKEDSTNVETLNGGPGSQQFNIPMVMCKRPGVNQWFVGEEALRYAEDGGILITDVLGLAIDGIPVVVEEREFDPIALLTLFIKRSLSRMNRICTPDRIRMLMLTCDRFDHRVMEVLTEAARGLGLKKTELFMQSHTESFYNYMIYQDKEIWGLQTVLFDYQGSRMKIFRMECNKHTTPIVAYIDESEEEFIANELEGSSDLSRSRMARVLDESFMALAERHIGGRMISGVYLVGDSFQEEWMKDSVRYLCRGRRVFQGNNLFSKGAALALLEKLHPGETGTEHFFLGNDKVKANVGMKVMKQGTESYLAILDAGVNWFEAASSLEFYMDCGKITLILTSLVGKGRQYAEITLDGCPDGLGRFRAEFRMKSEELMVVQIKDLGLGEIRKPVDTVWTEEIEL